ncbi:MAG: hypothetical protein ACR2NP_19025 [Pirellulaceae bacterium]
MSRIRVTCVHCDQLMEVRSEDTNRELRCVRCRKTFRLPPASDANPDAGEDVQGVIAIPCQECGETFGIRKSMQGKLVACPVCKAAQLADSGGRSAASPETKSAGPRKKTTSPSSKQPDKPAKPDAPVRKKKSTSIQELLPPRYNVPADVEAQVMDELSAEGSKGLALGIDTERTRIRSGGQAVDVRSLSREEKSRRKRIRVGIVYAISILILVALFVFLLTQTGTGD